MNTGSGILMENAGESKIRLIFATRTAMPKKTHGLSQKTQAIYFKIQGTYFKISALYF